MAVPTERLRTSNTFWCTGSTHDQLFRLTYSSGVTAEPQSVIPALDPASGLLPRGRFPTSETEIHNRFVVTQALQASQTRKQIWVDFLSARAAISALIPVLAAWIGGSFATAKLDPGDIDVLWLVDDRKYGLLDESSRTILSLFGSGKGLRSHTGWMIDSYLYGWIPIPNPDPVDQGQQQRFGLRGYWDDWFLRQKQQPKHLPSTNDDTVPRRGYLEVTYSAYL